ncbi:DUF3885 domain-containing protein [Pedobacter immunditicola]|uniref:DUF3885 domain-containing protein n=1 Tax=Pedobacter immunditicola TaxID=3133440 RepID=UPI003096F1A6
MVIGSLKQETYEFLNVYFWGLKLRANLFFNAAYGLRFNLQQGETGTDEYFEEVVYRATQLFEETFDQHDTVTFYLIDYKWKKRKIRFSNYCFKQIRGLVKEDVSYSKVKGLYEPLDKLDIRNIAQVKVTRNLINHQNILTAIANKDFSREPGLDKCGFLGSKEVFFINHDKQLIFHMYDDRGLDVVSSHIETLRPPYTKYNSWILESNKNQIDDQFRNL